MAEYPTAERQKLINQLAEITDLVNELQRSTYDLAGRAMGQIDDTDETGASFFWQSAAREQLETPKGRVFIKRKYKITLFLLGAAGLSCYLLGYKHARDRMIDDRIE